MSAEALGRQVAFGDRYQLIDLLAVGGMAEIFLARQPSRDEFEKDLVIKRLKPDLARDARIRDMFHDEARIGAILNHPNVVHVYDVGEEEGVPYIAMELIDGEELNVLCRRGLTAGYFLPLEHAVELVRQAALAMGYFHARRDARGEPLDIVHCDISPTNLLVTRDGFLKVIDFGIARCQGMRYEAEQVVPGKLSYMSPEQVRREPLDHRSDLFSLGVVLYEVTLGRRLFKGPAQEVKKRLGECDVKPPTFVRHDYPGALESVVMRALEADPRDRFENGYHFAEALDDYLASAGLRSGPVRIARYLDELAAAGGEERREELLPEEDEDEDALDFDRGVFAGFQAATEEHPLELSDWEEIEEDEQAVADALGIDVSLVRASAERAEGGPNGRAAPPPPSPRASDLPPAGPTASPLLFALGLFLGAGLALLASYFFLD